MRYLFLFLIFLLSCHTKKDFRNDFEQSKYDTNVIAQLPTYDSLKEIIINNIDSFKPIGTYYSSYYYNFEKKVFTTPADSNKIPKSLYSNIEHFFLKLGKDKIFGFSISLDSSIEIIIRNTHLTKYFLDVRERLQWKNHPNRHTPVQFPMKDSLLTNNWYYFIWFDKRSDFF